MSRKKTIISRRDFIKLGGISAVSLPFINKIDKIADQDLTESSDDNSGFLIRTLEKDDPPIKVDDSIYTRYDSKEVVLNRVVWDEDYIERQQAVEVVYKAGDPGYSHPDLALQYAASLCTVYDNTNSMFMGGHKGLLGIDLAIMNKPNTDFEDIWDYRTHSPEDVAKIVKRAAKHLGASLVGIAPMNERWIYSDYFDPFDDKYAPIEISKVEETVLPEGLVSPQEAGEIITKELEKREDDEIKESIVYILENVDKELLPSDLPPVAMIKTMPASQFRDRISMFTSMSAPILREFADMLKLNIEIANIDLGASALPRYLEDDTLSIPETMKTVIVLAFEMSETAVDAAPTLQETFASRDGYSRMANTAGSLALFIRKLGYNAIPCGNQTGLSIPQAIEAGLGEAGRMGVLITPKYGPRVRLAKVITDLPMAFDKPISFGVKEFCEVCKKCVTMCPGNAISDGPQTMNPTSKTANPGTLKWSINGENCHLMGWEAHGSDCAICIRVCPFNKPEGWLHEATRILIGAKNASLDSLLVKLDDASGYGMEEPKTNLWNSDK
jgi:reductive dehalogenase